MEFKKLILMNEDEIEYYKEIDLDLYNELLNKEVLLNQIYASLQRSEYTFTNRKLNQEGLVHPDSRGKYPYQFTYFREDGPVGDFNRNTLEQVALGILEYGFSPVKKENITILNKPFKQIKFMFN
ncbi:hypothetical protein MZM54_01130 [[Brevibacterium] frigoritolerans]|nr:hypothetical protein [Peribacillus frigoritolerans]